MTGSESASAASTTSVSNVSISVGTLDNPSNTPVPAVNTTQGPASAPAPAPAPGAAKERKGRFTIHRNMATGAAAVINGTVDSLESLQSAASTATATQVMANSNGTHAHDVVVVPPLPLGEQQDIIYDRANENVSPLSVPSSNILPVAQSDSVTIGSVSFPQQAITEQNPVASTNLVSGNANGKNGNLNATKSASPPPSGPPVPLNQKTQQPLCIASVNKPPMPPHPVSSTPSNIQQPQSQTAQSNSITTVPVKTDNPIPPLPPKVAIKGRFTLSTEMPLSQQNIDPSTGKDEAMTPTQQPQPFRKGQSFSVDAVGENKSSVGSSHPHRRVASVNKIESYSAGTISHNGAISHNGDANMKKFSIADRGVLSSNSGEGKIFNAGKLFYFLEQMKAEVAEADKIQKAVSSDSKIVRSTNKDLEKKCRDLERRLQEEQYLRTAAETKVKQLRKKLRDCAAVVTTESGYNDTVKSQESLTTINSEGLENQRNTDVESNRSNKGCSSDGASISDSLDKCFGEDPILDNAAVRALSPRPARSRVHSASSSESDIPKRSPKSKSTVRTESWSQDYYSSDEDATSSRSRQTSRVFDPLFSIIDSDNASSSTKSMTLQSSISQPCTMNIGQLQTQNQVTTVQQHSLSMNNLPTSHSQSSLNTMSHAQYQAQIQRQKPYIGQQQYIAQQQQMHHDPFNALAMRQVTQSSIQQNVNISSQVVHPNPNTGAGNQGSGKI